MVREVKEEMMGMTEMMRFQVCVHVRVCMCVCSAFVGGGIRSMFFKSDLNGFRDYTVDDFLPVSDRMFLLSLMNTLW